MKKNRIIILIVIVLALMAVILILTQSNKTFRGALSDFAVQDTATVTKIFLADKNNNTVTLTRESDGQWVVNNKYPASRHNIDMLLQTMHTLAVKEPVSQAAHNSVIRELSVNSVKVEIYRKVYRIDLFNTIKWFPHEKLTKVYYVGGATQSNRGTFMLMEGSSTPFVTYIRGFRGFVSPYYMLASIQVEIPGKENESYVIANNGNASISLYSYPENQPIPDFDTLAALNFLTGFRNLNFESILSNMDPSQKDSILASIPFLIITLTDTGGVSKTIKTYFKEGYGDVDMDGNVIPYDLDRLYALVNDGQDFVLIQYFSFDRVLRPRSFFLKDFPGSR